MSAKLDLLTRKLKPKPADDDLAMKIGAAVAQALAGQHHDMPTAAPQSRHMRALLRDMQPPGPARERFATPVPVAAPMPSGERSLAPHPGTAATAHRDEAAIAPPPMHDIPLDEIPITVSRDANGKISAVQYGSFTTVITRRDESGRMLEWQHADGSISRVTRRDMNGRVAGVVTLPPPGKKIYRRQL